MDLFQYTYNLVRQIPDGNVSSYGAVAEALGDRVAARAVGRMMNQNPDPDDMPCYKIVHSDGRLGGFAGHVDDKIRRLHAVNIQVKDGKLIDFDKIFFKNFTTNYPLKTLREEQIKLSKQLKLTDDFDNIETVAGIDVAYPEGEFDKACGACIVMDCHTKEILEEKTVMMNTSFPFISTYFAYREFPIVHELMSHLSIQPSVLLLDGNGILHPYRCGFACHAGLVLDLPTIGVAKTLLYGLVNGNHVYIDNEPRGYTLTSNRATTPLYVSPGHRISLQTSVEIVKKLSITKNPEPLRRAHHLAKTTLLQNR